MTGGIIPLVMAPVHNGEIGRLEPLAVNLLRLWQPGDHGADLIRLAEQVLAIVRRDKVVEDRSGDNEEIALGERPGDSLVVERHIAIWPKFKAAIAGAAASSKTRSQAGRLGLLTSSTPQQHGAVVIVMVTGSFPV